MPNYNHYTPQSDGSYRRSTVSEPNRRPAMRPPYPAQPPQKPPAAPPPRPPEKPPQPEPVCAPPPQNPEPACPPSGEGILSFLRGLLPREIDAADLLVISLLLLMNREEKDGGISPLLTIALYFLL